MHLVLGSHTKLSSQQGPFHLTPSQKSLQRRQPCQELVKVFSHRAPQSRAALQVRTPKEDTERLERAAGGGDDGGSVGAQRKVSGDDSESRIPFKAWTAFLMSVVLRMLRSSFVQWLLHEGRLGLFPYFGFFIGSVCSVAYIMSFMEPGDDNGMPSCGEVWTYFSKKISNMGFKGESAIVSRASRGATLSWPPTTLSASKQPFAFEDWEKWSNEAKLPLPILQCVGIFVPFVASLFVAGGAMGVQLGNGARAAQLWASGGEVGRT